MKQNYTFKIKCPDCGFKETDEEHFIDTETPCEDCGSHAAIKCPKCSMFFDHVWRGGVCSNCGLIIDSFEKCPNHPNDKQLEWCFDPLNRGS